ncbi:hypothetical protein [Thermovirga lienii]|uniref:hypothetical protein n=1 Tax=Thermovirga lienii TaxID=336261 RepID=UPI0002D37713|nr:hypothetical protein [Thermovirga lienii]HCD71281.1 hypothetical protein [Thermovirga lienii]
MFYRNLFAALCFLFLVIGLVTSSVHAYWLCLFCGAFSRTAVKKKWQDPPYARKVAKYFSVFHKRPMEE